MKRTWFRTGLLALIGAVSLSACFTGAMDGSIVIDFDRPLPDGVSAISYTIDADDFTEQLTGEITGDPDVDEPILVPAGENRRFTVVVNVEGDTPVTQLTADGTFNVVEGEIAEVVASLRITRTKLVVPDSANDRIVQVDDIASAGSWDEVGTDYAISDLEIGPDGRIYYTQHYLDGGPNAWIEVRDTVNDVTPETVFENQANAPDHIGIDHTNGYVYFTESRGLYRVDLDGSNLTDYSAAIATTIDGQSGGDNFGVLAVTVADDGIVYLLYSADAFGDELSVLAFDPAGDGAVIDSATVFSEMQSGAAHGEADIVAKGERLFVVFDGGHDYGTVLEVDSSLTVVGEYGTPYNPDDVPFPADVLYGPSRFVGHRNPEIQFIDEDAYYGTVDRIVEIEAVTDTDHESIGGAPGSGEGAFEFFVWPQ